MLTPYSTRCINNVRHFLTRDVFIRGLTTRLCPVHASKADRWATIQSVRPSKCTVANDDDVALVPMIAVRGDVEDIWKPLILDVTALRKLSKSETDFLIQKRYADRGASERGEEGEGGYGLWRRVSY